LERFAQHLQSFVIRIIADFSDHCITGIGVKIIQGQGSEPTSDRVSILVLQYSFERFDPGGKWI
jgi:hypothetical protein